MRCMNCDYNLCQNCAFSKLNENNVKPFSHEMIQGVLYGEGMLYYEKKYVEYHKCVCGTLWVLWEERWMSMSNL